MAYKISVRKNRGVLFRGKWLSLGDVVVSDTPVDDYNLNCVHIKEKQEEKIKKPEVKKIVKKNILKEEE